MSSVAQTSARFFGLDLSVLLLDLFAAWRNMLKWPVVAWLWPRLPVRLWLPDGASVLSYGPDKPHIQDPKRTSAARFEAVLLPEQLLLRTSLQLPPLGAHDTVAALSLHVAALSPFPSNESTWVFEIDHARSGESGTLAVHLVMASRRLVAQYLGQTHPAVNPDRCEVWVSAAVLPGQLVLPGFGEVYRARRSTIWRWVSALLVVLVVTLVAAMAVTPSAQLYLRVQQAHTAMAALQQKTAPVVKQRESLVHVTEQLNNLTSIVGKPAVPLYVLNLISAALPDDTYLTSLQVQGAKVSLTGQTVNAAALMKQLGATPGLHNVTAPTAAIKPLGAPREQFTIDFTLDAAPPVITK